MHRSPLLFALSLACLLPACAGTRSDERISQTMWVPSSAIGLATIQRDTSVALTRSETTDTLIFEETASNQLGWVGARRTWYVQFPAGLAVDEVLRFEEDSDTVIAWYREEAPGRDTHAVRASGSVRVHGRSEAGIDATVVLRATTGVAAPGELMAPSVNATRRATWVYDAPGAPVTPALETNDG